MSTRILLLVFVVVAAGLIFALLPDGRDGEPVSGTLVRGAGPEAGAGADVAASGHTLTSEIVAELGGELVPLGRNDVAEATGEPPPDPSGWVSGRLVDAKGSAIAGEPVLLLLESDPWERGRGRSDQPPLVADTTADASGAFRLPARPGAEHVLLAGGGRWPARQLGGVTAGDELLVRLEDGLLLEGSVVEAESGEAVAGAHVLVALGTRSLTAICDDAGAFRIGPVPDEALTVVGYAPGHEVGTLTDVLAAAGPLLVELPPGRELHGRVVDAQGAGPIAGATIRFTVSATVILPDEGEGSRDGWVVELADERETVSAADGSFELGPGPSSGFRLEVLADGYVREDSDRYVRRTLGEEDELVLTLDPLGEWIGAVVDAGGGEPAPGAAVTVHAPDDADLGERLVAETTADQDGRFALSQQGWSGHRPVVLTATDERGRGARARVDRDAPETVLELVEPARLTVRVEAGGVPVPGALVGVRSDDAVTTTHATGADGNAHVVHALAGPSASQQTLRIAARHAGRESLPVVVDLLAGPPSDVVLVDLDAGAELVGLVVDPYGQPVPTAAVAVERGARGHTDEQGRFRLAPVERDVAQRLAVSADGFRPRRVEAIAGAGDLYVTLDPVVVWSGRVVDAVTGLPLERATGVLHAVVDPVAGSYRALRQYRTRRVSGSPGEFTVELPEAGRYAVQVSARDYIDAYGPLLDYNGSVAPPPADIFLEPAAVAVVTVLDTRRRPVESLRVYAIPVDENGRPLPGGRPQRERTDAHGVARLQLGTGGLFKLRSLGWLDDRFLRAEPGRQLEWTCTVPAVGDLEVHVTDESGAALLGTSARLRSKPPGNDFEVSRRSRARASSRHVFAGLPPGTYTLTVSRRGSSSVQVDVFVPSGGVASAHAALAPFVPEPSSAGDLDPELLRRVMEQGYSR